VTEIYLVKGSIFTSSDGVTWNEARIQSIEWTEEVDHELHYDAKDADLKLVTTGRHRVTGRVVVKTKTDIFDTWLTTPRTKVPYFKCEAYDEAGTKKTYTFEDTYILGVAQGAIGIPPAVAERTYNFVAKSVTET